jgi:hypothetical protein
MVSFGRFRTWRSKEGTVVEVLVPLKHEVHQRPSVKELPFFGIWKDRTDIGDGSDYVNRLRENTGGFL